MSRGSESSLSRDPQASSSHYSFPTPMQLDANASLSASGQSVPPFDPTKVFATVRDRQGNEVQPEIHAKIDKGFFRAEENWTCYRRNYFSVACSYSLKQDGASEAHDIYLARANAPAEPVQAFAMCIAAKVDGDDGKSIELVQHTPKRDKGPMSSPDKRELKPNPTGNLGMFTSAAGAFPTSQGGMSDYDAPYPGAQAADAQNVTNFERIQFKKATANNGKRRAAQQFFHIVVELFARVAKGGGGGGSSSSGKSSAETEWVKVAHRVSARMVVRGRSPGHYQDERRNSSSSMGPHGGHGSHHGGGSDYGSGSGGGGGGGGSYGSAHHHGLAGSSYGARLGAHSGYQGHRHLALGPAASDTHSIASSSASSSMRSSLGPFSDHSSAGVLPMDDVQPTGPTHGYGGYYGGGGGSNYDHRAPSAGLPSALGSLHHHRSHPGDGGPGPTLDPPYLPMPSLKEEPFPRAPSIKPEPLPRGPSDAFALPAFGGPHGGGGGGGPGFGAWGPSEPPRDCRSMLLDSSKTYYPATQAL